MHPHLQKDNFKYKTESCKHFDNGKCRLGKTCRFAHGTIEKKPNNIFKLFNNFEEITQKENKTITQNKENLNLNSLFKNSSENILGKAKQLILNLNPAYIKTSLVESKIAFPFIESKSENFSETNNSNFWLNFIHNKTGIKNSSFKHKQDKETAIKFQPNEKLRNKKNNLEILYADPVIAAISFKKFALAKKGQKAENDNKSNIDYKCKRELFPKSYVDVNVKKTIEIINDSNSD